MPKDFLNNLLKNNQSRKHKEKLTKYGFLVEYENQLHPADRSEVDFFLANGGGKAYRLEEDKEGFFFLELEKENLVSYFDFRSNLEVPPRKEKSQK